jgi:hypothetical protein
MTAPPSPSLAGPSMHGQLLKTSRMGGSKLARFFVLNGRRLYYFNGVARRGRWSHSDAA